MKIFPMLLRTYFSSKKKVPLEVAVLFQILQIMVYKIFAESKKYAVKLDSTRKP